MDNWNSGTLRIDMFTDDKRYKIDESRRVYVYKNLHRNCYSVRQDGLIKMHTKEICLWDASFRVGKKGREKVLKEKRKKAQDGGGKKRIDAQHSKGKLTALLTASITSSGAFCPRARRPARSRTSAKNSPS